MSSLMKKPLFISFEGIDGSGKSTQVARLAAKLTEMTGKETILTREPGGTETANKIREIILDKFCQEPFPVKAESLLYYASRVFNTENIIMPSLEAGMNVICDRYFDSTLAYQVARGTDSTEYGKTMKDLNYWCLGDFKPDYTILLDMPVDVAMERLSFNAQGLDRLESEAGFFMDAARNKFLQLALEEPERFIVVNAENPVEVVHADIVSQLTDFINK